MSLPVATVVILNQNGLTTKGKEIGYFICSEHGEVDVLCIDYGTTELVKVEHIIYQSDDLVEAWLPQAHRCTLVAVQPVRCEAFKFS